MPDFTYRGRRYHNPVELALDQVGGKWKMPILWRLRERTYRYGELRRSMPTCTHNMLTRQLQELEADGYLTREAFAEVPPRVEYTITDKGRRVVPIIDMLREFGRELLVAGSVER